MAFVKLFPLEGHDWLPIRKVIDSLRTEFSFVDVDPDAGQKHVADMIAATLRFSDTLPHKKAQLADLQTVQDSAVYVTFWDTDEIKASCCLMKDCALFFDSPDEVDGEARSLVERLAGALNYAVYDG
jgi:hypothetical protein